MRARQKQQQQQQQQQQRKTTRDKDASSLSSPQDGTTTTTTTDSNRVVHRHHDNEFEIEIGEGEDAKGLADILRAAGYDVEIAELGDDGKYTVRLTLPNPSRARLAGQAAYVRLPIRVKVEQP